MEMTDNAMFENLPVYFETESILAETGTETQDEIKTPQILWDNFLESVSNGTFYMSFSKLKAFRKSPFHFYQYITKTFESSDAMKFGQVDHCLILEGEDAFNFNYMVLDRPTNLQCNASKDGKIGKIEFAEKLAEARGQGKELVRLQDYQKALHIRKMLLNDAFCNYILNEDGDSEIGFSYEYQTETGFKYKFRGRIDRMGRGFKLDLKNINNLSEKNISRHIEQNLLHLQASIYQMSNVGFMNDDYYIIAADTDAVLPVKISPKTIQKGKAILDHTLERFEMCYLENRWFESLGFWHDFNLLVV